MLLLFLVLSLPQPYSGVFHRLQDVRYQPQQTDAEVDMRIQLILIKPSIKKICENVKQTHSSHFSPILGKTVTFHKFYLMELLLFLMNFSFLIFSKVKSINSLGILINSFLRCLREPWYLAKK